MKPPKATMAAFAFGLAFGSGLMWLVRTVPAGMDVVTPDRLPVAYERSATTGDGGRISVTYTPAMICTAAARNSTDIDCLSKDSGSLHFHGRP